MTPADLLREAALDLENLVLPEYASFDMSLYGEHSPSDHSPEEKNYCGTAACALGWLTTMKKWQKRGAVASWQRTDRGRWVLDPQFGKDWEDLSCAIFGDDLGYIVQENVFEQMTLTREEAITKMRDLADEFEAHPDPEHWEGEQLCNR